jgi:hypothetical protein
VCTLLLALGVWMRVPGTSCEVGPVAFDVLLCACQEGVVHIVVFAPDTRESPLSAFRMW